MLGSIELLRKADQPELANEVAAHAEAVAIQIREAEERRMSEERMKEQRMADQRNRELRERQRSHDLPLQREVIGQLVELREQVVALRHEVAELREQIAGQHRREMEAKFSRVDLSGRWQITLPAGYELETQISSRGDSLYMLDVRGNFRGLYRHRGSRLRAEIPSNEQLSEFVWELQSDDLLLLTESPTRAQVGADYRGATLRRMSLEQSEEPAYEEPAYERLEQASPE
jgi:hypothetical protein